MTYDRLYRLLPGTSYHLMQLKLPHPGGSLHLHRLLLVSFLFARYKNAFPGLKKGIIDDGRDSEVKELEQTSLEVASRCKEAADANGNCKRLYDNWYMYQPDEEHEIVNRDDGNRYKYKRNHHQWIERHRDAKRHWLIDVEERGPQRDLTNSAQLC